MAQSKCPAREVLVRLYEIERISARRIADLYQTDHHSVCDWLRKHGIALRAGGRGLANRGITAPTRDELYDLIHVQHLPQHEIARIYGVDQTAITYWVKKHELPRATTWYTIRKGEPMPPLPPDSEIASLYEAGHSIVGIAGMFGVSIEHLRRRCAQIGVKVRPAGWDNKHFTAKDGHRVLSTYELRVDDWLSDHGIPHEYEPRLNFGGYHRADFLANGWYIEIWGVRNDWYNQRKRWKQEQYRSLGLPLIELFQDCFATRKSGLWERKMLRCLSPPPVTVS